MNKLREEFEKEHLCSATFDVLSEYVGNIEYVEWLEAKLEKLIYSKTNRCPYHERVVEDGYVQHYCNHNCTRAWK